MKINIFKKKIKGNSIKFILENHPYIINIENLTDETLHDVLIFDPNILNQNDQDKIKREFGYSSLKFEQFCKRMITTCIHVGEIRFSFKSVDDFNCCRFSFENKDIEGTSMLLNYNEFVRNCKQDIVNKQIIYKKLNHKFDYLSTIKLETINSKSKITFILYGKREDNY